MNIFSENIEVLPRELLLNRYKELEKYTAYLQTKVNEYEKSLNVEIILRQLTPQVKFFSDISSPRTIEKIIIPERKFWVDSAYVQEAKESINKYLRGNR